MQGLYENPIFGYSAAIPHGLNGVAADDPVPDHGFSIDLPGGTENYIWVSGLYNALEYTRVSQDVAEWPDFLKDEGASNITVVKEEPGVLCDLSAVQQRINYKDKSGRAMTQEIVTALRFYGERPGIEYTVGIRTTRERFDADEKIFGKVLLSFRCSPPTG